MLIGLSKRSNLSLMGCGFSDHSKLPKEKQKVLTQCEHILAPLWHQTAQPVKGLRIKVLWDVGDYAAHPQWRVGTIMDPCINSAPFPTSYNILYDEEVALQVSDPEIEEILFGVDCVVWRVI